MRIEFQDGKRRLDNADYGRGAAHLHACIFAETVKGMNLENKVCAEVPSDPVLRGVVLDSQCDFKDSGIPLREEASIYDDASQHILLKHPREAHELHIRPFVHEDPQCKTVLQTIMQHINLNILVKSYVLRRLKS